MKKACYTAHMSTSIEPPATRFVAYLRVSTEKQGRSGLGLEAQRAAVEAHVATVGGTVTAEFIEVESGRRKDRPQLADALADCRGRRAVLVIAKLDRLARLCCRDRSARLHGVGW